MAREAHGRIGPGMDRDKVNEKTGRIQEAELYKVRWSSV